MAHHIHSRLDEPGEAGPVEYSYPTLGVVYVTLTFPPLLYMCDMCRGEYHAISLDVPHPLPTMPVMLLDHHNVIW